MHAVLGFFLNQSWTNPDPWWVKSPGISIYSLRDIWYFLILMSCCQRGCEVPGHLWLNIELSWLLLKVICHKLINSLPCGWFWWEINLFLIYFIKNIFYKLFFSSSVSCVKVMSFECICLSKSLATWLFVQQYILVHDRKKHQSPILLGLCGWKSQRAVIWEVFLCHVSWLPS